MSKIQKRVLWISVAILIATIFYTAILPNMKRETVEINDKEVEQAVMEYANLQMSRKNISAPAKAQSYKVDTVKILQVKELPGPHRRRRIRCSLSGGYRMPDTPGKQGAGYSFSQRNTFIISDKYPSGLSVQLDN